jgi:hypothetical protein
MKDLLAISQNQVYSMQLLYQLFPVQVTHGYKYIGPQSNSKTTWLLWRVVFLRHSRSLTDRNTIISPLLDVDMILNVGNY